MIHIEHLHKSIGLTSILNDVSLHIREGEVVGLLGPNGAGKSTLMKVLTGLWKADSGVVNVCGIDVPAQPDEVHAHIGYLPEQNPLYADMYVREYLMFIARMRGQTGAAGQTAVGSPKNSFAWGALQRSNSAAVEHLIDRVGLTPQADKRIRTLSKGYKQRVGLAAAMIGDPEILILDEPTTGLDPNQLEDIRALIRELGKQHTVILSTHILQEVSAICNRVIIISQGQVRLDQPLTAIPDLEAAFRSATN